MHRVRATLPAIKGHCQKSIVSQVASLITKPGKLVSPGNKNSPILFGLALFFILNDLYL